MKYTERRLIQCTDLRTLCIKNNWYTRGDCEEYDDLFENVRAYWNIGTTELAWIAKNIKDHSDTDYEITNIMFELHRISYIVITEKED